MSSPQSCDKRAVYLISIQRPFKPFSGNESEMSSENLLSVCENGLIYVKSTSLPNGSKPGHAGQNGGPWGRWRESGAQ